MMNNMNNQERDILAFLYDHGFTTQRSLADGCGHSLGVVNRSLRNLVSEGFLSPEFCLTQKAKDEVSGRSPRNAIILAAGFGMRMVPINTEVPKALIEVKGEPMIERLIRQLRQVGIQEIHIVVGFMKDQFEYLIDDYGVDLIVNQQYGIRNNLHSLSLAAKHLSNTYIVPCDIWARENPFRSHELYSWYMLGDNLVKESSVKVNRKSEIVSVSEDSLGNSMIGISYLCADVSATVRARLEELDGNPRYDGSFWEETLYGNARMICPARIVDHRDFVEINTYGQLKELDSSSNQLKSEALEIISQALGIGIDEITDISILKKGMTNRSFLFRARGKRYIMRIPGEGTDQLINRAHEASVYHVINGRGICDDIAYINPSNGYKITEYLEDSRVCDPESDEDLTRCMSVLRDFHGLDLEVGHEFDIFGQMEFYETLWDGKPSVYRDYLQTKENVLSLKPFIDEHATQKVLTHIDAVPDNFLFTTTGEVRLIDWEYAGMQDPHVDVAMFCIYSLYDREKVDHLIDLYFEGHCDRDTRMKVYCYIAACGLLWSNWCEYKRNLGIEFGEYSLRQYRYAKDYYRIVKEMQNGNA